MEPALVEAGASVAAYAPPPGTRGRADCGGFHSDFQRRRPPVDEKNGRMLYWDVACPKQAMGVVCPDGDACIFAHGREEISYHPGKYKTRVCNGRGCRGEGSCCFAHGEGLRSWAAERYSYYVRCPAAQKEGRACPVGSLFRTHGAAGQPPYAAKRKARFCASYPSVSLCRRGESCAFAHSREECTAPLVEASAENKEPDALTEDFFIHKFKTLWCPIGTQHDWQTCVYAHNYQDARRNVSIGYGPRPCPYYNKKDNAVTDYAKRCPFGLRCPFSHGAKEQLYHPQYFRTVTCRDLRGKQCPRKELCAFFHNNLDKRHKPVDNVNYQVPLSKEKVPETWAAEYLNPPFFPEKGDPADEELMQMTSRAPNMNRVSSAAFWFEQGPYMASTMNKAWLETPRTPSTSDVGSKSDGDDTHSSNSNEEQSPAALTAGLSPWAQAFNPYGDSYGSFMPGFYPAPGFGPAIGAGAWWGGSVHDSY